MRFIRFCLLVCALATLPAWAQPAPAPASGVSLTASEQAWLAAHPVVRVGMDPDYAPYEWIDKNGHPIGMAVDYLRLLEKSLGVRFEIVKGQSWADALEMAQRGELDLLTSIMKTPARLHYLTFTEPYRDTQMVIIDNGAGGFIGSLAHLAGKRVALEKGYYTQELLARDHPTIELVIARTTLEALNLVLDGKADAYVGDAGTTHYAIKKYGLPSLRFSGQTGYSSPHRFAITKPNVELASMVAKAMSTIPQEEAEAISNRWLGMRIETGVSRPTLLRYGATLALLFFLVAARLYYQRREIGYRKEAESRMRSMLDAALDAVVAMDAQGRITDWNARAQAIFGWSKDEVLGLALDETIIPPQHRQAHRHALARFLVTGEGAVLNRRVEMTALRRNGEVFPVDLSIASLKRGGTYEFNAFIADITERRQKEDTLQALTRQLQDSEALYRQLTEDALDVIWKTDRDLRITYISPADERLRGYRADEVIGHSVFDMFTDAGVATVKKIMSQRHATEADGTLASFVTFEVQHRCKDGSLLWGEVFSKPERDARGKLTGHHGITREITKRKRLEDEVRRLAFYDPLTELPNRRLLNDRLSQAMAASKRTADYGAVMVLDLDNFKSLNDTQGHLVGDLLLREAAQRLSACVREMDTVARFGGDEFVVLLGQLALDKSASTSQACLVAEKIRASLAAPYLLNVSRAGAAATTVLHRCSVSIGLVVFLGNEASQEEVLRWADAAMYQAKEAGRNVLRVHGVTP